VIECDPTESDEVLKVATPEALTFPDPRVVPPSLNVTVPVLVPAPGATAATVAVKVIELPMQPPPLEVNAVVVLALLTTCVKVVETLVLKLPSPL
jgi:hypothetical protein